MLATAPAAHENAARRMATGDELQQFQSDFAIAQANRESAIAYLGHAEAAAKAQADMRRTRAAALEFGGALRRMHEAETYLDVYASWAALCRALGPGISRGHSYRLMGLLDQPELPDVPDLALEPVDTATEEPEEGEAEEEFAELRKALAETPATKLADEAIKPTPVRTYVWVEKQAKGLLSWFERERGEAKAALARPHTEALAELARE